MRKHGFYILVLFSLLILASGCCTAAGTAAGAGAGAMTGAAVGAGTGAAKGAECYYNIITGIDRWIKKNLW
jgi:hypothetical protein